MDNNQVQSAFKHKVKQVKYAFLIGTVLVATVLILSFTFVGCSSNTISSSNTIVTQTINPGDIVWVKRVGGLPHSSWKVLFVPKDDNTINKIVSMVNSSNMTDYNEKDYGIGKAVGYPVSIEIQLHNNTILKISPLFTGINQKMENGGTKSTATPYNNRVVLDIDNGKEQVYYTLQSKVLANYVLKGADQDMPPVTGFSVSPNTIKPGETITISGGGSTDKYIEIYITDGNTASNEKYLIAKVPTNEGSWKWSGTINGRTFKTLDGKEVKLTKDRYFFETTVAGGGTIDLSGIK